MIPEVGHFASELKMQRGSYVLISYVSFVLLLSDTTQMVKSLSALWDTWIRSLVWEDSLEKEMAAYSSILDWEIHGYTQSPPDVSVHSRETCFPCTVPTF